MEKNADYWEIIILDGNKKMAIFLDYEYVEWNQTFQSDGFRYKKTEPGWWKKGYRGTERDILVKNLRGSNHYLCRSHRYLPFFNDWNWLMKVVNKIETIENEQDGHIGVFINSNSCTIQGTNLHLAFNDLKNYGPVYYDETYGPSDHEDPKRTATWLACSNFIDWYNINNINENE